VDYAGRCQLGAGLASSNPLTVKLRLSFVRLAKPLGWLLFEKSLRASQCWSFAKKKRKDLKATKRTTERQGRWDVSAVVMATLTRLLCC
jgi:hypothetical protein